MIESVIDMETVAFEQQEVMKENRLIDLAFFKTKVLDTNLERYRLPTSTWLAAEMGNMTTEDLREYAIDKVKPPAPNKFVGEAEEDADGIRIRTEKQLQSYLDALRIDHDVDDKTPMLLSDELIQRAESLPDDHAQEAFIRGYMDFRLSTDVTRLGARVRDGETKPSKLPKDWEYLFEGNFLRALEDAHVYGRTAELDLDMLLDVGKATGTDLLGRLKNQAEQYLEKVETYKIEHNKQPLKPQSNGEFERKLRRALEERATTPA